MLLRGTPTSYYRGPSHKSVVCHAKAKKPAGKASGKGFGSAPVPVAAPRKLDLQIQLLEDLPPVSVDPESGIDGETRDKCLFFMNKCEELCGRLPKLLNHAWAQATAGRIEDCIARPVILSSPGHTTAVHILDVAHENMVNPAMLSAVWERVQPDAVALDVQAPYLKSFTRMAKAMDPQVLGKLLATPLTSLSGALDHADDFDRLRWHHAILSVVAQGASPIHISADSLMTVFASRDLHLAECIAAAHLAAAGGAGGAGGSRGVMLHGIDMEDDKVLEAAEASDFWSEADFASYRQRLLAAVEPQMRTAINTWLQGIPAGTTTTMPRQRFVLTRLEEALTPQQRAAFAASDAAWRASHSDARAREQASARAAQSAHLLARLRDVATGRLGGRRCARVLAVLGNGHADRIRQMAAEAGAGMGAGAEAEARSGGQAGAAALAGAVG